MGTIGAGEIFVIALVALFALDPKTVGRWWAKLRALRMRLMDMKDELVREVEVAATEPAPPPREPPKVRLRKWARERVEALGQTEIDAAPDRLVARLRSWETYQQAMDVAAYWPMRREIPLEPVLRAILHDGKTLWLPRVIEGDGRMEMVPVRDLDADLVPGRWGQREPRQELSGLAIPLGSLVLVPGEVFDLHGSRIGKGGGFYDRWLASRSDVVATGCCWDVQVHPGRLPTEPHDAPMIHLLTEQRLASFR